MSADQQQRIADLHAWSCRNVMPMRLTPEVERLWLEWLKAGYCGPDLRAVIVYLRRQIAIGKRNEGALKLTNLFQRSEHGFVGFDMDLGLARARANLNPAKKLEPAPDSSPSPLNGERAGVRGEPANDQPSTPPPPARPDLLRKLREAAQ